MSQRFDGRLTTNACGHDVAVLGSRRRRDHHVVAIEDAAPDHAIAGDAHEKRVVARQETPVDSDVALAVVGDERRLTGVNLSVVRNRLRLAGCGITENADAPRPGLIALDVTLARERVQQVRHGLRRLDSKLLRNLADARLVRVLRKKVDHVLVDASLQRRQLLRHIAPLELRTGYRHGWLR
jgi:hypothetical protein